MSRVPPELPTHTDDGLRTAKVIRERWPVVGLLVLSQHVNTRYALELLSAGTDGVGYLLKSEVQAAQRHADESLAAHGPEFGGDFGWAYDLLVSSDAAYATRATRGQRPQGPRFTDLQRFTGLLLFGPEYVSASNAIHASPVVGTGHLPFELQGVQVGPTVAGMRPAGNGSVQAVADVAAALVSSYPDPPDRFLLEAGSTLIELAEAATEMFRDIDSEWRAAQGLES
jgi:hypothetical protein